jgi:hypothetical protein
LEGAVLVSDAEHAALLADELVKRVPADFIGNPENLSVSVGRLLSMAAALNGKLEEAEDYCRQAIAACERARFRPELALCRLQLAEVLLRREQDDALTPTLSQREREDRRAEAQSHLDFVIEEFRVMNMQPSLDRALSLKA